MDGGAAKHEYWVHLARLHVLRGEPDHSEAAMAQAKKAAADSVRHRLTLTPLPRLDSRDVKGWGTVDEG